MVYDYMVYSIWYMIIWYMVIWYIVYRISGMIADTDIVVTAALMMMIGIAIIIRLHCQPKAMMEP